MGSLQAMLYLRGLCAPSVSFCYSRAGPGGVPKGERTVMGPEMNFPLGHLRLVPCGGWGYSAWGSCALSLYLRKGGFCDLGVPPEGAYAGRETCVRSIPELGPSQTGRAVCGSVRVTNQCGQEPLAQLLSWAPESALLARPAAGRGWLHAHLPGVPSCM